MGPRAPLEFGGPLGNGAEKGCMGPEVPPGKLEG